MVSTNLLHENENKQMDTDAFDFQEIKRVGQSIFLCFGIFYSLIVAVDIVICFGFFVVIIN